MPSPIVPLGSFVAMDFTEGNKMLNAEILEDINLFIRYVEGTLKQAGARYGIGGYNEHRTIYSRSRLFDADTAGEEPRRLHLGTDIWGAWRTPVMAPIEGIVHSFAFNNKAGDYGATIILSHQQQGAIFHTLYGHLSLNSIKNLQEGQRIEEGEVFAEFGSPDENGQWPPHLHVQVINDLQGYKGDYPGVCRYSERESWLKNSPDPGWLIV